MVWRTGGCMSSAWQCMHGHVDLSPRLSFFLPLTAKVSKGDGRCPSLAASASLGIHCERGSEANGGA